MIRERLIEKAVVTIRSAGQVVGMMAAVVVAIWVTSAYFTSLEADVNLNADEIADHECRIRDVESRVERIDANTSWIRDTMEGH